MKWLSTSILLLVPACDLGPLPPAQVADHAETFSLGYDHLLVVTESDRMNPGGLTSLHAAIPVPYVDDDGDGKADPLKLPAIFDVAAGRRHACVLSSTGTVLCWGDHTEGALGPQRTCDPPATGSGPPDCVLGIGRGPTLPQVRKITAGNDVTCATILEGDAVFCWGVPTRRGGSNVPVLDPATPVRLPDGSALAAARVFALGDAMCAIDHDAALWCWGDGFGERPEKQPQAGVVDIAIGPRHSCIIDEDGLGCWGENRNGQIGDLDAANACATGGPCTLGSAGTPHRIDLDATRVVVGERHTCALDRDGVVTCFGSNEIGQLGRDDAFLVGDRGAVLADGAVLDRVMELAGDRSRTCALRTTGELWCWGAPIGGAQ